MCGIIGTVGKNDIVENLHYGLKKLEYRGYDSAGVAIFDGNKIVVTKQPGAVDELFNSLHIKSNIGIAHTRWATHGVANAINSHPHCSHDQHVALVHNGIVENYYDLKTKYAIQCAGQTDTEVVVNVIEKLYEKCGNKLQAITQAMKQIKGSFALGILFDDDAQRIYFAKRYSPMLIGISKDQMFVSSDILGFAEHAKYNIDLPDDVCGYISKDEYKVFDLKLNQIELKRQPMPKRVQNSNKGEYAHYMIKEINEIPKVISETANLYLNPKTDLYKLKKLKNISKVKLIACGTSYHACLIGEKLLLENGIEASSYIASEFISSPKVIDKNTLCVFVSQSGETADTLNAVKQCSDLGARTLSITNVSTSTITKISQYVMLTECGAEIAVASTKAYNGQLTCMYILTAMLAGKDVSQEIENLKALAKSINLCYYENQVVQYIKPIIDARNMLFIGKNYDYVTALEGALKLKEISYLSCFGMPSGELKHGTIALVDSKTLILAYITERNLISKTFNMIEQTRARGAKALIITPFEEVLNDKSVEYKIALPNIDKKYYPLISIIPMQLLSYKVSVALGNNPDKPRNLAKSVTVE